LVLEKILSKLYRAECRPSTECCEKRKLPKEDKFEREVDKGSNNISGISCALLAKSRDLEVIHSNETK
jgi:hypothetical protein